MISNFYDEKQKTLSIGLQSCIIWITDITLVPFIYSASERFAHELNYSIVCFIGSIATGDLNFTSTQPVLPPLVPRPPQRSELQPKPNPRCSISNQPPQVPLPSHISIGLGGVEGQKFNLI
jgi:hypothetical protein